MKTFAIRSLLLPAALSLVGLSAVGAQAQTIVFNTFGPGDTYDIHVGWSEVGPSSVPNHTDSQGFAFTPSISGTLDNITLAISNVGGTNDAHLFLTNTFPSGANPPSLETWTLTGLPPFVPANLFTPELVNSSLHPLLTAGTTYYLYEKETGSEFNGWNQGQGTATKIESFDNVNYTSSVVPQPGAFRVSIQSGAQAVPEGNSLLLISSGLMSLVGVGLWRRRRRKG